MSKDQIHWEIIESKHLVASEKEVNLEEANYRTEEAIKSLKQIDNLLKQSPKFTPVFTFFEKLFSSHPGKGKALKNKKERRIFYLTLSLLCSIIYVDKYLIIKKMITKERFKNAPEL